MKDFFDQRSITCPKCNTVFFNYFPKKDKIEVIKKDSDFCKHYAEINPVFYEITVCPKCFFACESQFFEKFPVSKIDENIPELASDAKNMNFTKKRTDEEALTSFWLAIKIEDHSLKRPFKMANYYMKCGWIERYRKNVEKEDIYSEFSLINYEKLFKNTEMVEKIGKRKISYLIGEINKRLCDFSAAEKWFEIAQNETDELDGFSKLIESGLETARKNKDKNISVKKKNLKIADNVFDVLKKLCPEDVPKKESKQEKVSAKKDISDGYFSSVEKIMEKEIIFFENDIGNNAYIIKKGIVEIYKRQKNGKKRILARLGAGEVFGEMAMIASKTRTATAWAVEDTILLSVQMCDFKRLVEYEREFAIKLISVFRERLIKTAQAIVESKDSAKKTLEREHLYVSSHMMIKSDPKEKVAAYKNGELIFSECSSGNVGFIIKQGSVKIVKNLNTPHEIILQKLEESDIFGELALLGDELRAASAVACDDNTECYIFNKENFISMLRKSNDFAFKILKICVERIEMTNEILCDDKM